MQYNRIEVQSVTLQRLIVIESKFCIFLTNKNIKGVLKIFFCCFCAASFKQRHVQTTRRAHERVLVHLVSQER